VDEETPLFLSLPDEDADGVADRMCFSSRQEAPFASAQGTDLKLDYTICSADDVKKVKYRWIYQTTL